MARAKRHGKSETADHPLIGQVVNVEWGSEWDDWPTFRVLDIRDGMIRLQGVTAIGGEMDGATHDGDVFWCPLDRISAILENPQSNAQTAPASKG